MRVGILAGGMGTRLQEVTTETPKPMVEIGGLPILWHIMNIYACQGFESFSVALGYRSDVIKDFFLHHRYRQSDLDLDLASGSVTVLEDKTFENNWKVRLLETGLNTQTGGRVAKLLGNVADAMMLTYGDGVADVDLRQLIETHRKAGTLATVTAVRPAARFGHLDIADGKVVRFAEKRQLDEGWINGGFFVLEPSVRDYIGGTDETFEDGALKRLANDGQLSVHHHNGFWQCMDTMRDVTLLRDLWEGGDAPWAIWRSGNPKQPTGRAG